MSRSEVHNAAVPGHPRGGELLDHRLRHTLGSGSSRQCTRPFLPDPSERMAPEPLI